MFDAILALSNTQCFEKNVTNSKQLNIKPLMVNPCMSAKQ